VGLYAGALCVPCLNKQNCRHSINVVYNYHATKKKKKKKKLLITLHVYDCSAWSLADKRIVEKKSVLDQLHVLLIARLLTQTMNSQQART